MEGAERERREERGRKPERKAGEEVMEERRERGGVWGLLHAVLYSRLPTVLAFPTSCPLFSSTSR